MGRERGLKRVGHVLGTHRALLRARMRSKRANEWTAYVIRGEGHLPTEAV